jgi:hypothetical protein
VRAPMPSRVSKAAWQCSAPIEAEHELVKLVLEVRFPRAVVDAQAPTLEV